TVCSTAASSPPSAATASTSPQASAVGASIFSAVMTSQRARPQPISRGSSAAWITEGMPTRTSGMPNLASWAAIRKSQAAATSGPPPQRGGGNHGGDADPPLGHAKLGFRGANREITGGGDFEPPAEAPAGKS